MQQTSTVRSNTQINNMAQNQRFHWIFSNLLKLSAQKKNSLCVVHQNCGLNSAKKKNRKV